MGANQSTFDEDLDKSTYFYNDSVFKYDISRVKLPVQQQYHTHGGSVQRSFHLDNKGIQLDDLPIELCLHLLLKMKMDSLLKMARVSKKWNRLANIDIIFQKAAALRFKLDPSKFHFLSLDPSHKWKQTYIELDSGIATWAGFALDYITNHGQPYDMELIIKASDTNIVRGPAPSDVSNFFRLTQFEGCCRWRTLADSLTTTVGAIVDPEGSSNIRFEVDQFLNSYLSRHLTFTETGVVRGLDLVVPNIYQGLVSSNVILGSYDPGHPDLVGSFICVLQDSVPLDRNYSLKFKSRKLYTGIWMSSADKAIYMRFTIENFSSGSVVGTVSLYPFVSCRTTTRSAKVDLEEPVNLQLKFQVDSSDHKYLRIHSGQLSLISSTFYHEIWIQECVPVMQDLHINLFGDTIAGLFSVPRPGCFYLNPM
jgi:hypothetical protein